MNEDQAAAVQRLFEDQHPDAAVTATAEPGGVLVTINGPHPDLGLAGPGTRRVELHLGDRSPFLLRMIARHLESQQQDDPFSILQSAKTIIPFKGH